MDYRKEYEFWLQSDCFNEETKAELRAITDEKEIEDRFYKNLKFGTGGMRGIIGAGTNRMNIYTITKVTQGLANYILEVGPKACEMGVVIAHDSRIMSPEFCEATALCLNANGIKTYVFDSLRPTPELSFAVRELGCIAGIVITASHNPPEYNGYKVYWEDGSQIVAPHDKNILAHVAAVPGFDAVRTISKKKAVADGLFNMVMGYGVIFLLPCIIGVIAAMLFFMERDNDTFKNLRTIPVTSTQMIMAKIIVLFIFGVIFCLASMLATIVCGSFSMEVHGLTYKLLVAVELGIFITAGTLPIIVLVVFFSKTYIFSILLCVFYSVVSLTVETLFGTLPKWLCWLMPIPLTTLWGAGDMVKHGFPLNVNALEAIIPSTFQTVIILGIMAVASISLIDFLYKKRGE